MKAPLPTNEAARLAAFQQYHLAEIGPQPLCDELTQLAANLCSAPIAGLCFVDASDTSQLRYQSQMGSIAFESDREGSFCAWAMLDTAPLIVADTTTDERFKHHPLVTAHPGIRFFAGAPVLTSDGQALGALCIFDWEPRTLSTAQVGLLRTVADAVMAQLECYRQQVELGQASDERAHLEKMLRLQEEHFRQARSHQQKLTQANHRLQQELSELQQEVDGLAVSEERYALAVNCTNDGVWDWELKTNQVYYSPRWKAMLGYEEDELTANPDEWLSRIHPEDLEAFRTELAAHLAGLTARFQHEHRLRQRDGAYRWMLGRGLAVRDEADEAVRMAGLLMDISGQKQTEQQLRHNALHDALTGLPNRLLFMDRLKRSMSRSKQREDYLFAMLFVDLDRFKLINDSLGHEVGDQLLVSIARRLEVCLRPGDMVARLGGDEFGVILDHLKNIPDATSAGERVQQELSAPFNIEGQEIFVSASVGIALSLARYDHPEDLLRDADTAMYQAKKEHRGGVKLFSIGMHARAVEQMQLETDLRGALGRQELQVYYQPIILLDNWRVAGFEALMRWNHPQHGFISPVQFIPLAEENGLIVTLGEWALRESCRQLRSWQEMFPSDPPLTISVNLSGRQFAQPNLIEQIQRILTETRIEPGTLKLEITESAIIENTELATDTLKQLQELGIRVSLDDFGTGYSSLSYLKRFRFDTLKIDRSFVAGLPNDPDDVLLVKAILAMAKGFGLKVVAEGVENNDQLGFVAAQGCDLAQGYLLARPMNEEAYRGYLKNLRAGVEPLRMSATL